MTPDLSYATNLIRRAYDKAGVDALTRTQLTQFVQSRVSPDDRHAVLLEMEKSGELSKHYVETSGRAKVEYRRDRVIPATDQAPAQTGAKFRESNARQRKNALVRELAQVSREVNLAIRENTAVTVDLIEALKAVAI
jgi:hypothetical protein